MATATALEEALRVLQLPIYPTEEKTAIAAVNEELQRAEIPSDERGGMLLLWLREWRAGGHPPMNLQRVVGAVLTAVDRGRGARIGAAYFDRHALLCRDHLLDFDQARAVLSHVRRAASLVSQDGMSCAQVAVHLEARHRDLPFDWKQVQAMLGDIVPLPSLGPEALTRTEADAEEEEARFADADDEDAIDLVAEAAAVLGSRDDVGAALRRLVAESPTPSVLSGLLIVLHFQALACEFYDHPPVVAYEFEPRSQASLAVQARHPLYKANQSAYLNMVKGHPRIDRNWAMGRRERGAAIALADVLAALDKLAPPGRRSLARWLRQWALRVERLRAAPPAPLGAVVEHEISGLFRTMADRNTETFGILEQRAVDAVAAATHDPGEWLPRGLGDSVYAPNLRRRKLGDCEFESGTAPRIRAFEAHGGALTAPYVDDHLRTAAVVLDHRQDELLARAPAGAWDIEVLFVAHAVRGLTAFERRIGIEGFPVRCLFTTFDRWLGAVGQADLPGAVNKWMVEVLNRPFTPEYARDRFRLALGRY